MELTWSGRTCFRLKGRDAVVIADPYQSVVGPTGRGITAEIVTDSHPDHAPLARANGTTARDGKVIVPGSLEDAFILDGPGEYEIRHVLLRGAPPLPQPKLQIAMSALREETRVVLLESRGKQ